jgi:hypothetical protein
MATLHLRVPPEKFSKNIGDNGSYSLSADELLGLPYGSTVEVEDTKDSRHLKVSAGDWKEYGTITGGRVYLPLEYFTKK